ncbi:MAG: ATP-binding protein, partial [Chloroflexota bacterium]
LRQIFLNVLSNAVKYTLDGTITVRAFEEEDFVQIAVEDTGIGIPHEDYELVFESFQQAGHNLENVVSTGLGLPITKRLLEFHGGEIWFESKLEAGTTFYIKLPK